MPLPENGNRRRNAGLSLGGVFKGVLIGTVGLFVLGGLVHWLKQAAPPRTFASITEAYTETHPGVRAMYAIFQENYPEDYKALADGVDKRLADRQTDAEIGAYTRDYMQRFMAMHMIDIMHAPSARLADLRKTQTAMMLALQASSAELCATYDSSGLPKNTVLDARSTEALEGLATARMAAAAAGKQHRTDYGLPKPSDWRALSDALDQQGLTTVQRRHLGDETLTRQPASEQCAVIVIISKAEEALPPEVADRLTAEQYRALSAKHGFKEADVPPDLKIAPPPAAPKVKTNGLPPPPATKAP